MTSSETPEQTGQASPEEDVEVAGDTSGLRQLWELRHWVASRPGVAAVAGLSLVAGLIEAVVLGLVAAVAAAVAQGQDTLVLAVGPIRPSLSTAAALATGTAATVIMAGLRLLASRISADVVSTTLVELRTRLLSAYLSADYETQRRILPAELHDLLVFQSMRMSRAIMMVVGALTGLLTFIALMTVALLVAPLTAGLLLLVVAVLARVFLPFMRRSNRAGGAHLDAQVEVGVQLGDVPGLLAEIHTYGARDGMLTRAAVPLQRAGDAFRTAAFVNGATPALYLTAVFLVLFAGLAALTVVGTGDLQTLGAIVLLTLRGLRYSQQTQSQLQVAVELSPDIRSVTRRIRDLEATEGASDGMNLDRIDVLEFDRVGYRYEDTDDGIHDVSITLHRGDVVGVVGHSGAGKSTFAEVVLGLRHPTTGHVRVNGQAREQIDRRAWFDRVAYVGQESRLLAGSVADNVAFFRELDDVDLTRVLEASSLGLDLERWGRGHAREVGAGGRDVSGGQRQRVAIARALVGDPDLLVMDEPTSSLDPESEQQIRDTIAGLGGNVLVVVIAHRRSTLSICNRLLEFTDGRLREVPTERAADVVVE